MKLLHILILALIIPTTSYSAYDSDDDGDPRAYSGRSDSGAELCLLSLQGCFLCCLWLAYPTSKPGPIQAKPEIYPVAASAHIYPIYERRLTKKDILEYARLLRPRERQYLKDEGYPKGFSAGQSSCPTSPTMDRNNTSKQTFTAQQISAIKQTARQGDQYYSVDRLVKFIDSLEADSPGWRDTFEYLRKEGYEQGFMEGQHNGPAEVRVHPIVEESLLSKKNK